MSNNLNIVNLLIILFIVFILFILYHNSNCFTNLLVSNELFINPADIESKTGNIESSSGSCEKPNNPKYVAANYLVCCSNNKSASSCMCSTNKMINCRKEFDKCFVDTVNTYKEIRKQKEQNIIDMEKQIISLESQIKDRKVPYFQIKTLEKDIKKRKDIVQSLKLSLEEEPEVPAGIKKQCQNKFIECASNINLDAKNIKYLLPNMKKKDTSSNKICEILGLKDNNIDKCKNYCNNINNCKSGIYNKMARICELYDKTLIDKEQGAEAGDFNYIPFIKEQFTNNKKNNSSNKEKLDSRNKARKLLNDLDNKYKSSSNCKDTVNNDLKQLNETYIFQEVDNTLNPETDLKTQLCKMNNISLSKCKSQCLMNDMCQYIYYGNKNINNSSSNINIEENSKYFNPSTTCKLFKGFPLFEGDKVKLSKNKDANGIYYLKITRESVENNMQ